MFAARRARALSSSSFSEVLEMTDICEPRAPLVLALLCLRSSSLSRCASRCWSRSSYLSQCRSCCGTFPKRALSSESQFGSYSLRFARSADRSGQRAVTEYRRGASRLVGCSLESRAALRHATLRPHRTGAVKPLELRAATVYPRAVPDHRRAPGGAPFQCRRSRSQIRLSSSTATK